MLRRDFLKTAAGTLATASFVSPWASLYRLARANELSGLDLGPGGGVVLAPRDAAFSGASIAFNKRTQLAPALIARCESADGVARALRWARERGVAVALRCGGHSYEGFSQTRGLVIDVRAMNSIVVDPAARVARVGAGATLGQVYDELARHGLALPGGTCPTVGISGHAQGGGYGLLARKFGLACDRMLSLEMVDADGRVLRADAAQNADLFWACRGAGGGHFGVATEFEFSVEPLDQVSVYGVTWMLPPATALKLVEAWQSWAPSAPDELTALLTLSVANGVVRVHGLGQYVGPQAQLDQLLKALTAVAKPGALKTQSMPWGQSVNHFGGDRRYSSVYMKAKSDYLFAPMSDAGILMLFKQLGANGIGAILDAYGGAISRVANDATAFSHRQGALYSIQYSTQWAAPAAASARLKAIRDAYAAMRPFVSGAAYVNYCDTDLADWGKAYYGDNFARLIEVKKAYDPANVFRHAQSIPVS